MAKIDTGKKRKSSLTRPVAEIYEGYKKYMATRQPRGDTPVAEHLQAEFGIEAWEWTRLKRVYDLADAGDPFAQDLLQQVDRREITISGAYRMIRERDDDDEAIRRISSIKLEDVLQHGVRAEAFFRIVAAALRRKIRINRGNLSDEDIAHCITTTRAAGLLMKQVADQLSRETNGGSKAHAE